MSRNWFREDLGSVLAERTALLAAIATTGRTFGRGLMPRTRTGQALATGLTGSINYGLLATSQSALWAGASVVAARMMPEELPEVIDPIAEYRGRVRLIAYGTYGVAAASARPLQKLVAQQPGESVARAVLRGYLYRLEKVSIAGAIGTGLTDVAMVTTGLAPGPYRRRLGNAMTVVAGGALAVALVQAERRRFAHATGQSAAPLDRRAIVAGLSTAAGLTAVGKLEGLGAGAIASLLEPTLPRPVGRSVGHAMCLGVLGIGVWQGVEYLYRRIEASGSALESLHEHRADGLHVSGGPASLVEWSQLSREGRRFAGTPLSRDEIESVMGECVAEPVRVFIPLQATEDPQERARVAVEEMIALGAFQRPAIVLCSPTGTGYVNYVMVEALEYLTRGDCATVAVQYSLRPSFMSLNRVSIGRENATALLAAVSAHVETLPEGSRPRLLLFGESLGAHTAQDVALHRGVAGFDQFGIQAGLFIGTPEESKWAKQWRTDPASTDPGQVVVEVDSCDEFQRLSGPQMDRARFVLVSHTEDPITKFGPELAIRRPGWLDPDRSKRPLGIPPEVDWRPLATFFVTIADVLNSMTVIPGQFGAEGHDYRQDLARFVSTTYRLPCTREELDRIELALRRRELQIAKARLVADQYSSVRRGVSSKLADWGVASESVEDLIDSEAQRSRNANILGTADGESP